MVPPVAAGQGWAAQQRAGETPAQLLQMVLVEDRQVEERVAPAALGWTAVAELLSDKAERSRSGTDLGWALL